MVTRRGTRHSAAAPTPTCLHCGASGHIATICPRTTYTPDPPSLTCNNCIRTCRSGWSDEPDGHQMIVIVDPCQIHATPVVRPTRANPAPTTSRTTTVRPSRPPPPPTPNVTASNPNTPAPTTTVTAPSSGSLPTSSSAAVPDPATDAAQGSSPSNPVADNAPSTRPKYASSSRWQPCSWSSPIQHSQENLLPTRNTDRVQINLGPSQR